MEEINSPSSTPKWLKRLQENSWEAEILISGGAIFGLFALSDYLIGTYQDLKNSATFMGMNEMIIISMIALKALTIGFLFHITVRGLWIALVCLNYSFPNGINFDKLKLTSAYLISAKKFDLFDQIEKLNRWSGIMFFCSFAFTFISFGLIISIPVPLFLVSSLPFNDEVLVNIVDVFTLFLFAFYVDLLSTGWIRKNRIIGKIYYPIYFILNFSTLGFIYRPWLQILFSNVNKWKASIMVIIYLLGIFFYVNISLAGFFTWESLLDFRRFRSAADGDYSYARYDSNINPNGQVFSASIPSEIISGNFLKVFVPYKSRYDDGIIKAKANYFSGIVTLSINNNKKINPDWISTAHPVTRQKGIMTFILIDSLKSGKNVLKVYIEDDSFTRTNRYPFEIFFWKN